MHSCLTRLKYGDVLYYRPKYTLDHVYFAIRFLRYDTYNSSLIVEDSPEEDRFDLRTLKVITIKKAKKIPAM